MRILHSVFLAALVLVPGLIAAQAPTVQALYADALAKEKAVRTALADDLPAPAALKAVRTVVGDYEAVVRRHPASGYSDDALWNGGQLSFEAFAQFGETHDRTSGERLFRVLLSEYPTSKWVKQAAIQIASRPAASPTPTLSAGTPTPGASRRVATITRIDREVLPESVRVTIHLDGEATFRDERLADPARVFLDVSSARLVPALADQTLRFDGDDQPVRQIRTGRHPNQTARVVLEAAAVASYTVYALHAPFRLVIECVPARTGTVARTLPMKIDPPIVTLPARRLPPESTSPLPSASAVSTGLLQEARRPEAVPHGATGTPMTALPRRIPSGVATVPPVAPMTSVSTTPPSTSPAPSIESPAQAPATGASAPVVAAAPPARNLAGGFSIARQLGLGVSRIVIDPGHGGHDPGAKGRGVSEAEVVLDVALRLEKLLAQVPGVEVILTRRTDDYVPLEHRTAIANREGADLFLSIHANASNNTQASGVETYFLNFASNLSAASVAARENAASGQTMGALPDFVKTIALNNKLDESKDLATYIQRAMIEALRPANKTVRDLGVKQAPFVVLIGAAMPSVLTEISFVTNSQDAKLLKNGNYRQRIADALFKAVQKYQASLKTVGKVALQ